MASWPALCARLVASAAIDAVISTRIARSQTSRFSSGAPPAQACAKLQIDARSAKAERLIGTAQLKTAQAAQDARTDADEAARLLRAYELRRNAEDGETFAVDQLSSPGAIAGVCFRDDVEGDAILGDLRTPLAAGRCRALRRRTRIEPELRCRAPPLRPRRRPRPKC